MKLNRRQLIGGAAVMAAMPGIPSAFAAVKEETRDLVIVGGGLGGLSAANAAVNKGCKALVIEKLPFLGGAGIMPEGSLGINTKYQKA
ncbi:MAG: FAD-dependent oxidoreductase, partial [Sutterella wadsworthensis]